MSFVVRVLLGVASVACPTLAQAQTAPTAPPTAAPPVRVYIRNEGPPLTFSARAESGHSAPTWCISPCDVRVSPGDYQLKLNGRPVDGAVALRQPGTLHGEYQSRTGMRSAAWLAMNLGGIIGGVFITVGAAGGSKAAFAIGGGVLAGAGLIFLVTYRSDRASISFTPDPPPDVRGMPEPATMSGSRQASSEPSSLGSTPRGVGFRVAF
ncbi:MAG: hypothetical protein WDO74_27550 [Pseudomonadota bacterium]